MLSAVHQCSLFLSGFAPRSSRFWAMRLLPTRAAIISGVTAWHLAHSRLPALPSSHMAVSSSPVSIALWISNCVRDAGVKSLSDSLGLNVRRSFGSRRVSATSIAVIPCWLASSGSDSFSMSRRHTSRCEAVVQLKAACISAVLASWSASIIETPASSSALTISSRPSAAASSSIRPGR